MLLKVLKKSLQKEPQATRQDAFRILRENIKKNTSKEEHSIVVTSTLPSEGKNIISEHLSTEFALENKDVLLIQTDPLVSIPMKSEIGLSNLYSYLTEKPLQNGKVSDYGLFDLFFLIYVNYLSGNLYLKSDKGACYEAIFRNGVVCSLKTPHIDLNAHLGFLNQIDINQIKNLKKHCSKRDIPLIHGILQRELFSESELFTLYSNELITTFKEFTTENFDTFQFSYYSHKRHKSTVKLMNNKFLFIDEPLEDKNYIARCIHQNIYFTDQKYYCMPRGSLPLELKLNKVQFRLSRLFDILKKQFDHIFVNTPPLKTSDEGSMYATIADQTLLVIKSEFAKKDKIERVVRQLQEQDIKIIGTVLNEAPDNKFVTEYRYIS